MRLVAQLDDAAGRVYARCELATGAAAAAFARWSDGLPSDGHGTLLQLRAHGYACDLGRLEAELVPALEAEGLPSGVRQVGERLLQLLAGRRHGSCLLLGEELGRG